MDATQTSVRPATPADVDRLQEIVRDAYALYLPRMDRKPAPLTHDLGPDVEAGLVWVAGTPVRGLISLIPQPGGDARAGGDGRAGAVGGALLIENVAVDPAAQGTGTGRLLMDFAEARARELGLCKLTLYTNELMTENLSLYNHLGFAEVDRREEDGFRRVFMEKGLG